MSEDERFMEMYLEREREIGRLARYRSVRGFEEAQDRSQRELRRVRREGGAIGRARGILNRLRGRGRGRGAGVSEDVGLEALRRQGRVDVVEVSLGDEEVEAARQDIHSQWI